MIHILTDLKTDLIKSAVSLKPEYVRVLASNSNGFEIINEIKRNSGLKVITKFSDTSPDLSNISKAMLEKEILATDLYYYGLKESTIGIGKDYLTSPYILGKQK